MARPQPTDAHLRIAHSITEAIMLRDFTKRQRKILDLILRLSWGCGKKEAIIPHQNDFCAVGIYKSDIKKELDWLEVSKIITRNDSRYWFNKDFDQWQISRVHPYMPDKVSELLTLNINGKMPKVSETRTNRLVRHELYGSQNTNQPTPKLASPKERLKKVKERYIYIEEYPNVKITQEEQQKLIDLFGGAGTKDRIENLSLYIASKGDKYKSHYATILSWDKRDRKTKEKVGKDGWTK